MFYPSDHDKSFYHQSSCLISEMDIGSCSFSEHDNILLSADYVVTLNELGKEQKFEVTYVEVEEKNDEDQTQCLVQLSTLPVAVRAVLTKQ